MNAGCQYCRFCRPHRTNVPTVIDVAQRQTVLDRVGYRRSLRCQHLLSQTRTSGHEHPNSFLELQVRRCPVRRWADVAVNVRTGAIITRTYRSFRIRRTWSCESSRVCARAVRAAGNQLGPLVASGKNFSSSPSLTTTMPRLSKFSISDLAEFGSAVNALSP